MWRKQQFKKLTKQALAVILQEAISHTILFEISNEFKACGIFRAMKMFLIRNY